MSYFQLTPKNGATLQSETLIVRFTDAVLSLSVTSGGGLFASIVPIADQSTPSMFVTLRNGGANHLLLGVERLRANKRVANAINPDTFQVGGQTLAWGDMSVTLMLSDTLVNVEAVDELGALSLFIPHDRNAANANSMTRFSALPCAGNVFEIRLA
jgi:hypothetical protein